METWDNENPSIDIEHDSFYLFTKIRFNQSWYSWYIFNEDHEIVIFRQLTLEKKIMMNESR